MQIDILRNLLTQDGRCACLMKDGAPVWLEETSPFHYRGADMKVWDRVEDLRNGVFKITRTWVHRDPAPREAVLLLQAWRPGQADHFLIPAVSYDGNRWGTGGEPKGWHRDGRPWVFSALRTAVPGATFTESDRQCLGLWSGQDAHSIDCACSIDLSEGICQRILWPGREEPLQYNCKDRFGPAYTPVLTLLPGKPHTVTAYIGLVPLLKPCYGFAPLLDAAWDAERPLTPPALPAEEVRRRGIAYLHDCLLERLDDRTHLINIGLLPNDAGSFALRQFYKYESGWCGQNITIGQLFMAEGLRRSDQGLLKDGCAVLDTWVNHAVLPGGLMETQFDRILSQNPGPLDTCNLGWTGWQLLEGWKQARKAGLHRPAWRSAALHIADFFVTHGAPEGGFGKLWSPEGACLDSGGSVGCYVLLALLAAWEETGDDRYRSRLDEGLAFYRDGDLAACACSAGALDSHCIDMETSFPLLHVGCRMAELTGDVGYLETARTTALYQLTWMAHHDGVYGIDNEFTAVGYHPFGAMAVSTQHHHLGAWNALLAPGWLALARLTGDLRWQERARALWANATACISDGETVVHSLRRPLGAQNEAYYHCMWDFVSAEAAASPGRVNDWLVAWPGVFRLLALQQMGGEANALYSD